MSSSTPRRPSRLLDKCLFCRATVEDQRPISCQITEHNFCDKCRQQLQKTASNIYVCPVCNPNMYEAGYLSIYWEGGNPDVVVRQPFYDEIDVQQLITTVVKCREDNHHDQILDRNCLTCKVPACRMCVTGSRHLGHVFEKMEHTLDTIVDTVKELIAKTEKASGCLSGRESFFDNNLAEIRAAILKNADHVKKIASERAEMLIVEAEAATKLELDKIRLKRKEVDEVLAILKHDLKEFLDSDSGTYSGNQEHFKEELATLNRTANNCLIGVSATCGKLKKICYVEASQTGSINSNLLGKIKSFDGQLNRNDKDKYTDGTPLLIYTESFNCKNVLDTCVLNNRLFVIRNNNLRLDIYNVDSLDSNSNNNRDNKQADPVESLDMKRYVNELSSCGKSGVRNVRLAQVVTSGRDVYVNVRYDRERPTTVVYKLRQMDNSFVELKILDQSFISSTKQQTLLARTIKGELIEFSSKGIELTIKPILIPKQIILPLSINLFAHQLTDEMYLVASHNNKSYLVSLLKDDGQVVASYSKDSTADIAMCTDGSKYVVLLEVEVGRMTVLTADLKFVQEFNYYGVVGVKYDRLRDQFVLIHGEELIFITMSSAFAHG